MSVAEQAEIAFNRPLFDLAGAIAAALWAQVLVRPLTFGSFALCLAAITFTSWDLLDQRGVRAMAWAIVAAMTFGLFLAACGAER